MSGGHFSYSRWDPVLISSQIVAIQCTFYTALGLFLFIITHLFGYFPTLDLIFNSKLVNFRTGLGLVVALSFILNSLFGSLILYYIVRRAKKCLDFSLTCFLIHLLFVWIYSGQMPWTFSWWFLVLICATIMCVAGEYLCLKSELKAIPLLVSGKASSL